MKTAFENTRKGMDSLMPALALMSPAFWVAWIELIYCGEVHWGAEGPTSFQIIINYTISTTAMASMLIAYGFFPKKVEALLNNGRIVIVAGAAAAVSTFAALAAPMPVWTLLTGVFTSVLAVRFAQVYASVNPKAAMASIILSQMVASFIYGYVLSLPHAWQPLFLCLLPLIAGVCSLFDAGEASRAPLIVEHKPTTGFLRLVCALFVFSVAINVVRGFYPSSIEMDAFAAARGNSSVIFFFAKMVLTLIVLMLPLRSNLGKLSYYGLVGLAVLTVPLPLIGLASSATLELFGCINALLNIVVWSLLSGISYKSGRSPVRLLGWGWGVMSLGSVVGWLVGLGLFTVGFDSSQRALVEVMLLVAMLLACIFVVTWQVVDTLFDPFDDNADESLVDRTIGGKDTPLALEPAAARCNDCPRLPSSAKPEKGYASACNQAGEADALPKDEIELGTGRWRRSVFEMAQDKQLSGRESDVVELLLKGYTKQHIAEELFIAYNTVRSHVRKVYVKCDVHSQQELITLFECEYLRH